MSASPGALDSSHALQRSRIVPDMAHPTNPSHGSVHHSAPLTTISQVGGGLGIAGCCIGMLVFFGACFGFSASLYLSPLPLVMGLIGFVLTIVGAVMEPNTEGPAVAAGLFLNLASIVGGLMEMAAWLSWKIFA